MPITVLPARLANQIAAGEVVERPASVVKELVENSIDARASQIKIEIEKGGAKRIKITDNGKGIIKEELTLALSRHATSKIKTLDDLEAISSLGFRGEALASISSVARLTLTSKPAQQASAWQAYAQGRDMDVAIKPAAHPDGTTIDVVDLFFNTPARRKFLRTEKTEFSHIEEVVKRIALANFAISFTLVHNQKVVKQFRSISSPSQHKKRIAQICGQKFVDHAIEVDYQHNGLHLYGWLANADFYRNHNDLAYSFVNGRMMRDKLINHAIRQAYADLLPRQSYPAFVLFFQLNYEDVDVNVHPAKHEVRFHQGRYVHDFILSVCQQALVEHNQSQEMVDTTTGEVVNVNQPVNAQFPDVIEQAGEKKADYIIPLRSKVDTEPSIEPLSNDTSTHTRQNVYRPLIDNHFSSKVSEKAAIAYSELMTPIVDKPLTSDPDNYQVNAQSNKQTIAKTIKSTFSDTIDNKSYHNNTEIVHFQAPSYLLFQQQQQLRILSVSRFDLLLNLEQISKTWPQSLPSKPLLLPIKMQLENKKVMLIKDHLQTFNHLGIVVEVVDTKNVQIKQFPEVLRKKDVSKSFDQLLENLQKILTDGALTSENWQRAMAELMIYDQYSADQALNIWQRAKKLFNNEFEQQLSLNSVEVDLTSSINRLA